MWEVGTPKGWVITISVSPSGPWWWWWWFIPQKAGLPACLLATGSCRCTAAHPERISHLWQALRLTSIMTAPLSEQARPKKQANFSIRLCNERGAKKHTSLPRLAHCSCCYRYLRGERVLERCRPNMLQPAKQTSPTTRRSSSFSPAAAVV